jgi:hypothetical protein
MTIGFITVISGLVLWSVSITKKSFDRVIEVDSKNQFSLVFQDFIKTINKQTNMIKKADDLEIFLSAMSYLPVITEPQSGVGIGFSVESKMDKININYILNELSLGERSKTYKKYKNEEIFDLLKRPLYMFLAKYEIASVDTFLMILLDSMDKDDIERGTYSEISSEDFDFREGRFYSFNHFKKAMDRYYKITRDNKIYLINKDDFETYFYFGDSKTYGMIDINSLEFDTVAALLVDAETISMAGDASELFSGKNLEFPLKEIKQIYNISEFDKKKEYLLKCIVNFNTSTYNRNISFDYEIKSKRIENIDKNFQE